jgi:hypothetical protein
MHRGRSAMRAPMRRRLRPRARGQLFGPTSGLQRENSACSGRDVAFHRGFGGDGAARIRQSHRRVKAGAGHAGAAARRIVSTPWIQRRFQCEAEVPRGPCARPGDGRRAGLPCGFLAESACRLFGGRLACVVFGRRLACVFLRALARGLACASGSCARFLGAPFGACALLWRRLSRRFLSLFFRRFLRPRRTPVCLLTVAQPMRSALPRSRRVRARFLDVFGLALLLAE